MADTNYTSSKGIYLRNQIYWGRTQVNGVVHRKSLHCSDLETAKERYAVFKREFISLHYPVKLGSKLISGKEKNWIAGIYKSAKRRALLKGVEFNIDKDDIQDLADRSGMKCEVTGIKFSWNKPDKCRIAPYLPSLDRIEPSIGYTKSNIRLVCWAANIALSDWGDEVFINICKSVTIKILTAQ